MTKQELRKQIATAIKAMDALDRNEQSHVICQKILDTEEWRTANTVLLYCALPDEVSLQQLIDEAMAQGKNVVLPVVVGDNLLLRYYDPQQIAVQGKYQIEEPTDSCKAFKDTEQLGLAVIPGRAFSPDGNRMGRGKGYYDRLLPQIACKKFGVAFTCQMIETIPVEEWDIPMDRVFSV